MKNKFLKFSKWTLYILFILLIPVLIGIFAQGEAEEIDIPSLVIVPFLVSLLLALICIAISYVMCITEKIKTKDMQFWKNYLLGFVCLGMVYTFIKWGEQDLLTTWIGAAVSISAIKATEYIIEKRD